MQLVDVLKALADNSRLAILCFLQTGSKCVCEIEQILSVNQSATSKHLHKLRMAGLIAAEKKAQWVHYSIADEAYTNFPFLKAVIETASLNIKFDHLTIVKSSNCLEGHNHD